MNRRPTKPSEQWCGIAVAAIVLVVAAVLAAGAQEPRPLRVMVFTADWCRQCQLDKKHYPKLKARYGRLLVHDYDADPWTAIKWRVTRLPTYIVVTPKGEVIRTQNIKDLF